MFKVTKQFIAGIKLSDEPAYRIAQRAGIHPATLSKILHGNEKIWPNDRRVLAVAKVVGLDPDECFKRVRPKKTLLTEDSGRNDGPI